MKLVKHIENGVTSIYLLTDTGDVLPMQLILPIQKLDTTMLAIQIAKLIGTALANNMIEIPEVSDLELKELQAQMKKKKIEGDFEDAT